MKYGIIYKITNLINGLIYIGQTTNSIEKRFNDHCKEKRNRHISNAIRKYGKENFLIEELCSALDKHTLNNMEIHFVNHFNSLYPFGYNHRAGGNQNGICSEELKMKISKAKSGKKIDKLKNRLFTKNHRQKISRTLGGQEIIAISIKDNSIVIFNTAQSTKELGHNPSNIVQICKQSSNRKISKGYKFFYLKNYANQNGSTEINISEHVQRIGFETTNK